MHLGSMRFTRVVSIYCVETGALKNELVEGVDYNLLPEEAWQLLTSWYGLAENPSPTTTNEISR